MAKFIGAILECMECGKEFRVPPARRNTAKYCSNECADLHRNEGKIKEKLKRVCPQCGRTFKIYPSHLDRRKYCSYECRNKAASYLAPLDSHFYNRTFWRKLRTLVLERDKYRCQKCFSDERKLHVHHKKDRFSGGEDKVDNLISLCNCCHKKTHYGSSLR
jgi:5-methylcytosine-specific restriction endonuclease McrA